MDNFEIIFKNFLKKNLNTFINDELLKYKKMIRNSHFFDNKKNKDLTVEEVSDFANVLDSKSTGFISFSKLKMGVFLNSVVVVFSFDELNGDIVINLKKDSIFEGEKAEIISRCEKILKKVLELKNKYSIPVILIGLEPAEDEDTCLLKIDTGDIDLAKAVIKIISCELGD